MSFVYEPERQAIMAEERARSFVEFILDVDNLRAVIVILVFCETPKTTMEVVAHLKRLSASTRRIHNALDFIHQQGLDRGNNGRVHAIPHAVDEVIHRIENNGNASPPPNPMVAEGKKVFAALDRVNEALAASGYHTVGKRRMRVVS